METHRDYTIKDMQALVKKRNGRCLSKQYISTHLKLMWQCHVGHKWSASPANVKRGTWCPICDGHIKSSIDEMTALVRKRGGKCLSKKYINANSKLRWRCNKGHVWEAIPSTITQGAWCPVCAGNAKSSIENMRFLARKRGGKCLSKNYINNNSQLKWRCSCGHVWKAIPSSILRGSWCPFCYNKRRGQKLKLSIEEMRALAKKRRGWCLSKEYTTALMKLKWKCNKGHIWEAIPNSIKSGHWCPKCSAQRISSSQKLSIQDMHKLAHIKGGKCLSKQYVTARVKLKWKCSKGHIWEATPDNIYRGKWCPKCAGNELLDIFQMKDVAKERGGKCLSNKYINSTSKLKWQCSKGHIWKTAFTNIKSGRWCPICSSGLCERICRIYFEQLFKRKFPKVRPKWLRNKEGNPLELDGYCKSLKLAFEHQGGQHYDSDHFYSSNIHLKRIKRDDKRKRRICERKGITLITIPEIFVRLKLDNLKVFIKNKLKRARFKHIPKNYDAIKIKMGSAYNLLPTEKLKEIQKIVHKKGGRCLSKVYLGSRVKMTFQCNKGHIWETTPSHIKAGKWCHTCGGSAKSSIEEMVVLAKKRGGKCLSKKYLNNRSKLKWQCGKGHIWKAARGSIKSGQWCPICARKVRADKLRLSIDDMKALAKKRGGVCLSKRYFHSHSKLRWKCKENHIWSAEPASVRHGTWCPICAVKHRTRRIT